MQRGLPRLLDRCIGTSERVDIEAELDEQRDGVRCSCRSPNDKAGSLLAREWERVCMLGPYAYDGCTVIGECSRD